MDGHGRARVGNKVRSCHTAQLPPELMCATWQKSYLPLSIYGDPKCATDEFIVKLPSDCSSTFKGSYTSKINVVHHRPFTSTIQVSIFSMTDKDENKKALVAILIVVECILQQHLYRIGSSY